MLRLWLGALWWSRVWRTQHPFLCTAGEAQIPINQKSGELKALSTLSSQTPLRRIPHLTRAEGNQPLSSSPPRWMGQQLLVLFSTPAQLPSPCLLQHHYSVSDFPGWAAACWHWGVIYRWFLIKKKKKKLLLFNLYNKPWGFAKSPQAWMAFPFCSQDKLLLSLPSPVTCAETLLSVINSYISKPAVERIPIIITTLSATITTVNKWW